MFNGIHWVDYHAFQLECDLSRTLIEKYSNVRYLLTIIKTGVRKLISNACFDNVFMNDTVVDLKNNHSTTKS